jgi:CheY-like chemotaxis protein
MQLGELPLVALHWHATCTLNSSALVLTVNCALAGKKTTVRLHLPFVGASMPTLSSVRVLVVDDFKPFRRFICSTLGERGDLQLICEVSDGLEAVQMAGELKPDLIVLDIALPTLNGLEAARQIRKLAPESKIIFVSQESSPEVAQEALNLGAWGYVVKTTAAIDLPAAVEAVLEGRQFVSGGLAGWDFTAASPRPPAAIRLP